MSPHRLLGKDKLRCLLEKLACSYRYVLIDTPPALAASEALVIAAASDASLLCVMRDVSRIDQVKKAYDCVLAATANPLGVVLNGVSTRSYSYRYGSYPSDS